MFKGRFSGPFIFLFCFLFFLFAMFFVGIFSEVRFSSLAFICIFVRQINLYFMTGILEIEEMEFFAYHGCFEAEQTVGNKFKVYACLHYNCDKAAVSDQITDALSYQTAYEIIAVEMMKRSHLLEHVGLRILDALYAAFPQLLYAKIKISKMNPPLGGQIRCTSVTLEK
jgi:dihydroneopterin aldolase